MPANGFSPALSAGAAVHPSRRRGAIASRRPARAEVLPKQNRRVADEPGRNAAVVPIGVRHCPGPTGDQVRGRLLRSWGCALDSASEAIHAAQTIGVFKRAEVEELERGIRTERAWLRSLLGDGSISKFP